MLPEQVVHAEARELRAVAIDEERAVGVRRGTRAFEQAAELGGSLCPDRADADLASFAAQPDLVGRFEPHVPHLEIKHLLHAGAGVEHHAKQGEIALAGQGWLRRRLEQRLDFALIEVLKSLASRAAFERYAQHALHLGESLRMFGR